MVDISVITNPDFFVPAGDLIFSASIAAYALYSSVTANNLANSTVSGKAARKHFRLHTASKRRFAIAGAIWFLGSTIYKISTLD